MTEKKKRIKNLSTYVVCMILTVVILIIFAAMADNRESQFENQLQEKEKINMSIQNQIVTLTDENYTLKKEQESLHTQLQEQEKKIAFLNTVNEVLSLHTKKEEKEAKALFESINTNEMDEEIKAEYQKLKELLNY